MKAFGSLGTLPNEQCSLTDGELHKDIKAFEEFMYMPYDKDGPYTLPALWWKLLSTKNKEVENLPPYWATIVPHIQRSNYLRKMHKSYHQTHPELPPLTESGWTKEDGNIICPVHCLVPPAPRAILELIKCSCKAGDCSTIQFSYNKNRLLFTSLCTCSDICSNRN